jgi:excisionase family DNA binding protein
MDDQLLRVEDVARLLQVGRSKVYSMAAAGTLPGVVRVGGSVRVSAKALSIWIAREAGRSNAAS